MVSAPSVSLGFLIAAFIPWIIIVGYLTRMAYQKTDSFEDMNIARGHWGPIVLGFSAAATLQSAATILGVPGLVYGANGFPGLWLVIAKSTVFGFGLLVFAKVLQHLADRFGSLSIPDWVGHMYESDSVRVLAALLAIFQLAWLIAQVSGASQVISGLTPVPYRSALLASIIVTFGYVFIGGESATQLTDTFQGILMIIVVALAVVSGLWIIPGGITSLAENIASQGGNTGLFTDELAIFSGPFAIFAYGVFFFTSTLNPAVGKKLLSLDSNDDIKVFVITAIAISIFLDFTAFAGLYAVDLFANLPTADQAILYVINLAYPSLLVAAMAVAIFSATVTTMNSVIVSVAVSFSNDIYRRALAGRGRIHGDKTEEEIDQYATWIYRVVIVLLAIVSGIFALSPPQYINVLVNAGNFGFTSTITPLVAIGAIWKKPIQQVR